MKQDWRTLPFEKSIVKVKYTTKIASTDYLKSGLYPIISQEEGLINGYWNNEKDVFKVYSPIIVFGDHTRILKYVDFDFVIGADGVKILQPINKINAKFLKYYIESCRIPSLGYSRHYKLLKKISVPIPPMIEQERIVAELDLLSDVIAKKREQLKQLDTLAQSIFYDMFGDPITNEKGWETKKLDNICDITSSKRIYSHEYVETGIPFYRGKEISEKCKSLNLSVELFIPIEKYEKLKETFGVPKKGDLLLTAVGTIGNIWIVDTETPFYFKDGNILWLKNLINTIPIFFKFLLELQISELKNRLANGCAYNALTIINMKALDVIAPPIHLQQEFASKIKSIEKQKELIKQSLSEVQQLFDSRMDYYFN